MQTKLTREGRRRWQRRLGHSRNFDILLKQLRFIPREARRCCIGNGCAIPVNRTVPERPHAALAGCTPHERRQRPPAGTCPRELSLAISLPRSIRAAGCRMISNSPQTGLWAPHAAHAFVMAAAPPGTRESAALRHRRVVRVGPSCRRGACASAASCARQAIAGRSPCLPRLCART
jgi:hypothetical protein